MGTASFRLVVAEQQEAGVRRALAIALRSTLGRPGCTDGRIERDVTGGGGLRFHSRWDNSGDLRTFLASDVMTRLLQLLELSVEEPEVLICWGDSTVGLSSLREIRGAIDSGSLSPEAGRSGCGCETPAEPFSSFSFRE